VDIYKSIIISKTSSSSSIACPGITISQSVIDDSNDGNTPDNFHAKNSDIPLWFTIDNGIYKFKQDVSLPFAELTTWQAGDPSIDFFKNLRPTVDKQPPGAEYLAP